MDKRLIRKWAGLSLSVLLFVMVLLPFGPTAKVSATDEFDTLRERHKATLTGGASYNLSDPDIAARVTAITNEAQGYWTSMLTAATRTKLWNDAALGSDSTGITTTYNHLRSMAIAYNTYGSTLNGNASLKAAIIDGLDWMNSSPNGFYDGCNMYQNWWHWQIGGPLALNDIVALMYNDLTSTQIGNYMAAINYAQPSVQMTGANRLWESQVIAIEGINAKDSAKIAAGRDGLSALLPYVLSGDGFYKDGSFIQHTSYAYTLSYGAHLLGGLAQVLYDLAGSTWDVTDANISNVYKWIHDSYEPLIYNGNLMDMVRGREISRWQSQDNGEALIEVFTAILQLSQIAPTTDATSFKQMMKYWLQLDTQNNFLSHASIDMIVKAKAIVADSGITSRGELLGYKQFASMDRALQLRPGFGYGISMFSSRIGDYESANAENSKGWHTGDGMTYLYNNDLSQFNDNFWPTVNSYRLPGTTVLKDTAQTANVKGDRNWVGGTDMLGLYGVTGMDFHAVSKTLEAKKSWFMFDDEVVALGASINSTDGVVTESIVENRKINTSGNNALTVNGTAKSMALGWTESMTGTNYIHLAGNVTGSDIGYYFPGGATVNGLREARTGNWKQINSAVGWSSTNYTRNYLTLWFDHGSNPTNQSFSYVVLPNKTATQVSAYAASPNVTILENSTSAQAVKETGLNITGINFWNDAPKTVGLVTSNRKASVMMRETTNDVEVSVSDPTQANVGTIYLEVNKNAKNVISQDPEVTILQYSPTIKFKVNVNKSAGKSFKVKFSLTGMQAANPSPIPLPDKYEAETLPVNLTSKSVSVINDANASGGKKLSLNHTVVGDYTEFSVDVPQAGTYPVTARIFKTWISGIQQLSIDGTNVGTPVDMYWTTSEAYRDITFGNYTFSAPGSYLFRFTTTGQNASAGGFREWVDYIKVGP
ncbi:polysaccharide lyase family 8 super-sandwich domain-containing protein [Paenibacillus oryzisoli]|uniref:polysaccharide lyase family 8 super-sandwich domain-containing protein n=1 Tax=Paenibacillus oryzisoli TaxID=1850517 RepID=UPI003D280947